MGIIGSFIAGTFLGAAMVVFGLALCMLQEHDEQRYIRKEAKRK